MLVAVKVHRIPRIRQAQRATVHHLGEGFHQVVLHFGFSEQPDVPAALGNITVPDFGIDAPAVTYFIGSEQIVATDRPGTSLWRERLHAFMNRNASSPIEFFGLPSDRVVAIGVRIEI